MRLKMPCADTAHARGSALVATVLVALLSGCATAPPPAADGWRQQTLPGKPLTHYRWTHKEGRTALQADSQQSASLWRKRLNPAQDVPQQVRFSWWVQDLIPTPRWLRPTWRTHRRVWCSASMVTVNACLPATAASSTWPKPSRVRHRPLPR